MTDCKKAKRSALTGLICAVKRFYRSRMRGGKDGESAASRRLKRVNFSVSGDLGKNDKSLEMNENCSKRDAECVLKTCSNSVDEVLKNRCFVENLSKVCSKPYIPDWYAGCLKNPTADKNDGNLSATTDSSDGRTTDSSDGHIKKGKKVTTTTIYTSSPLYPPAGEKSKDEELRRLPDVKNFSGEFTACRGCGGGTMTDLLFGLPFCGKSDTCLKKLPTSNDSRGAIPPS